MNPNNANAETQSKDVQEAARAIGQKIQIVHAGTEAALPKLGRVDKLNPDADGGKQHECGEALGQFVVAGGDPT